MAHERLKNEQLAADAQQLKSQISIMEENFDQAKEDADSLYQREHALVMQGQQEMAALELRASRAEAALHASEQRCLDIEEDSSQLQTTLKLQGEKKAEFLLQMDQLLEDRSKALEQLRRTHEETKEELRVLQEQHWLLERAHEQTEQLLREKHELVQMLRESTERSSARGSEKMRKLLQEQKMLIDHLNHRIAQLEAYREALSHAASLKSEASESFDAFRRQLAHLHHIVSRKLAVSKELKALRFESPSSAAAAVSVSPEDAAQLMELNQLQENRIFLLIDQLQAASDESLGFQQQTETLRNSLGEALEANDELLSECKRLNDDLSAERDRARQLTNTPGGLSSMLWWFSAQKPLVKPEQPI